MAVNTVAITVRARLGAIIGNEAHINTVPAADIKAKTIGRAGRYMPRFRYFLKATASVREISRAPLLTEKMMKMPVWTS